MSSGNVNDPGSAWFGGGHRTQDGGMSRNVRLIAASVAAFVAVLGLSLFLHLYICHVRRRNRRRAEAAAAPPADALAKAAKCGLEPSAIAALPTSAYREAGEAGSCTECTICLGVMQEGDAVRVLPACTHVFHVPCVDTWLSSSSSCPVCRAAVEPPPPAPAPTAAEWVAERHVAVAVKEEAGSSAASRGLGACASIMKMLSRERPAPRRPQGDHAVGIEDLESQQPQQAASA